MPLHELRAARRLTQQQLAEALGLTQKQLATRLHLAESTLSRWETGAQIQQRAMDLLLRMFFEIPQVRTFAERNGARQTEELAGT